MFSQKERLEDCLDMDEKRIVKCGKCGELINMNDKHTYDALGEISYGEDTPIICKKCYPQWSRYFDGRVKIEMEKIPSTIERRLRNAKRGKVWRKGFEGWLGRKWTGRKYVHEWRIA